MDFKAIDVIVPENAKGKYFRQKKDVTVQNLAEAAKGAKVILKAGSLAYCYSCNFGSIFLGLEADTKRLPIKRMIATGFAIAVQFGLREVFGLFDIEK